MSRAAYDFVLAIGDDRTDEDVFRSLPPEAYSIHVGSGKTAAQYNLRDPDEVFEFLSQLATHAF
jgi:trehalose 6-phosphate synthase/phosphatase